MTRSEVLISSDVKATIAEIEARGGAVTQVFAGSVVVARLTSSLDPTTLHSAQLWDASGQYQGDQVFREAVQLFRDSLADKPQDDDKDGFELDTPCCDRFGHEEHSSRALPAEGVSYDNSIMAGGIAVAIVFVSSDGAFAFSDGEKTNATSQVLRAFHFLANAQPAAKMNFVSSSISVNVPGDILVANVGISSAPSAVIFNGKLYCFHQGGHNDGTLWYSVFDGANWSADTCVRNVAMSSSPSAVVFYGKLYCFFQGTDKALWYSVFDGINWSAAIPRSRVFMASSPSAVVFNGRLYCFLQGTDSALWYSVFDGTSWSAAIPRSDVLMASSPSAVVYNGRLYCLLQGIDNALWYSVFDGTNWSAVTRLNNVAGPSHSPIITA